jgi:hypothetical protein
LCDRSRLSVGGALRSRQRGARPRRQMHLPMLRQRASLCAPIERNLPAWNAQTSKLLWGHVRCLQRISRNRLPRLVQSANVSGAAALCGLPGRLTK